MLYCLLTLSRRIAMSLIVIVVISDVLLTVGFVVCLSHDVGESFFYFSKVQSPADKNADRDDGRHGYHQTGRAAGSEKCPTKSFHNSGHRVDAVQGTPGLG